MPATLRSESDSVTGNLAPGLSGLEPADIHIPRDLILKVLQRLARHLNSKLHFTRPRRQTAAGPERKLNVETGGRVGLADSSISRRRSAKAAEKIYFRETGALFSSRSFGSSRDIFAQGEHIRSRLKRLAEQASESLVARFRHGRVFQDKLMWLLISKRGREIGKGDLLARLRIKQKQVRLLQIHFRETLVEIGAQLRLGQSSDLIDDDLSG